MKEIGNTLPKRHLWRVYVGTSFSIASATLRLRFRQPWRPLRNQYGMATPFSWIQWDGAARLRRLSFPHSAYIGCFLDGGT